MKKNITEPLIEENQYDGGNSMDTVAQAKVQDEVLKIEALQKGIEEDKDATPSKFEFLFRKRYENFSKDETVAIIVKLFGHKKLEGDNGLNLNTIIKYVQFSRIDNEIEEKNQRAKRLLQLHYFNTAVSLGGPVFFWVSLFLSPTYWNFYESHNTSLGYVVFKFMQCGFKYALFNELKNKLLFEGEVQKSLLVVDKDHF